MAENMSDGSTQPVAHDGFFLAKREIVRRIVEGQPGKRLVERGDNLSRISNDPESYVGQWNCDLHLGREAYLSSSNSLTFLEWGHDLVIRPGEFALLTTEELVNLPPDIAGAISIRFSVALKGLINISGRHVDPYYSGRLLFSVYNAGSNKITVRRGEPIFMMTFAALSSAAPPKSEATIGSVTEIRSDWIQMVRGPPVSLGRIDDRLRTLEIRFDVFVAVLAAATTILSAVAIAYFFH